MRVLGGWTARVTENEERLAFARDLGFRAEHGNAIKGRLHRLRTTEAMVHVPDENWRRLIELIDEAPSTADVVAAVYGVMGSALVDTYGRLVAECDPLADELTIRLVERHLLPDHHERNAWAMSWLEGQSLDDAYQQRVGNALAVAGGLAVRDIAVPDDRDDVEAENGTGFWPLPRPNPELMALGSEYRVVEEGETASYCPDYAEVGQHDAEVLFNHHGLMPELASLAIVGALIHEVSDRPWEFYAGFAVQAADEVRHVGLLLRRLEQLGAGPSTHAFPTWTFYDAVAFLPAAERTLVFNAIVEGNVVETLHDRVQAFVAGGSPDSAYVSDWISADESLHLHNGMRWLEAAGIADVDALLAHGQALLGVVMRQKDATEKIFDSASESLAASDFYAQRTTPVAPIVRRLGGFAEVQIERLVRAAGGRIHRH